MIPDNQHDILNDFTSSENFGYQLASPLRRLGAVLIEGIIVYLPLYFVFGDKVFFNNELFDLTSTLSQAVLSAVLGAVCYALWSGNLGHKLLGMKVISAVDGVDQKVATTGALREGLKSILGMFVIPSIWLLWDKKKQNLYDKITNTLVVMGERVG